MNKKTFKEKELNSYYATEDGKIYKNDIEVCKNLYGNKPYLCFGTNSLFYKVLGERLKHRIIATLLFGNIKGKIVDHINNNKTDNSFKNLRIVDTSGNTLNSKNFKGTVYKLTNIKTGEQYIFDNVQKVVKDYKKEVLADSNIYKLIHKVTKKSRNFILEETNESKYKDMFNFAIKLSCERDVQRL